MQPHGWGIKVGQWTQMGHNDPAHVCRRDTDNLSHCMRRAQEPFYKLCFGHDAASAECTRDARGERTICKGMFLCRCGAV